MAGIKFAAWVHGNNAQAEQPTVMAGHDGAGAHFLFNQQTIVHLPNGTTVAVFQGPRQGTNWFHFTPTTPAVIDGARPQLTRCFVLFDATSARVTQMDLFDGATRVAQIPNPGPQAGHNLDLTDDSQLFVPPQPITIRFGLGISVKVDFFFDTSTQQNCRIWFGAAGADFEL
jgi:hypothetical protein